MDNTSWYRTSRDIKLKNGDSIRVYQTVFETSDYALSEESVDWCRKAMDRKTEDNKHTPCYLCAYKPPTRWKPCSYCPAKPKREDSE